MRTTSTTPGSARRLSVSNCSTSPTSPTIVRCTPRLTNAEPPASCTVRTTASSCSAVASGAITTTMTGVFHARSDLEPLDCGIDALAWADLDQQHRDEHEKRTEDEPRSDVVTAERHAEDPGEHRLHRHHDRGSRRMQVHLRPRLHEERQRRRGECGEQDGAPRRRVR